MIKKPKKNVMKKIWQQKKKKEKHDNNDNWKKRDYCKWDQLLQTLQEKSNIFDNLQMCSLVDLSILIT